jgi:hypothetical protein
MKPSLLLGFCLSVSSVMTPLISQAFDAESFFASNFIVDGLGTYYEEGKDGRGHPYPSPEGPWDFKPLKQETGCNMIIMSYRTQASFEAQSDAFAKKRFKNALLIRSFDDIRKVRDTGDFEIGRAHV